MTEEQKGEYAQKIGQQNYGRHFSIEINKKKGRPGETNPFYRHKHSKETKEVIGRKARIRMSDPVERQRIIEAVFAANRRHPNKAEFKLEYVLTKYFSGEWEYTGDGHHIVGGYAPDFSNMNGIKAVIELFGEYWHTRTNIPEHYTESGRIEAYKSLGFHCLVIWEHELKDEQSVVYKVRQFKANIKR
ncbi:MAG: hypothetical protein PHI12_06480 [Dehalococcoidales bacterium]|nr:hypothetical protein [Dehalococcoidales bacterium]